MTKQSARISPKRLSAALFCALVLLCLCDSARASLLNADASPRFSNGLLAAGGLTVDDAAALECADDDADPTDDDPADAHAHDSLFLSLALADCVSAVAQDDALVAAVGEERAETETSTFRYNGAGYGFTQDVVVRGSVSLPSVKALQFWGNGYSGSGYVKPNGYGGVKIPRNNTGASLGLNLPLGASTITGFYNYHRDREFFGKTTRAQQTDNSYGMAYYLNSGGFYINAAGLYGTDKYLARSTQGRKNFKGSQCAGGFETGYSMMTGGLFVLEPFGAYTYSNVRQEAFNPATWVQGDGKKKYNSCKATLGSRVDVNLAGLDSFTLQGRIAWITELRKKAESMTSFNYGRVPGTFTPASPYYVGQGGGSDLFWAGCGLRLSLMGMLALSVDYDCLFNRRQNLHEGSFGLLFGF